jgi:hypothetical protein
MDTPETGTVVVDDPACRQPCDHVMDTPETGTVVVDDPRMRGFDHVMDTPGQAWSSQTTCMWGRCVMMTGTTGMVIADDLHVGEVCDHMMDTALTGMIVTDDLHVRDMWGR